MSKTNRIVIVPEEWYALECNEDDVLMLQEAAEAFNNGKPEELGELLASLGWYPNHPEIPSTYLTKPHIVKLREVFGV